jgi:hypothetical protein
MFAMQIFVLINQVLYRNEYSRCQWYRVTTFFRTLFRHNLGRHSLAQIESVLCPPAELTFGGSFPPVGAAASPFLFASLPTLQRSPSSSFRLCIFPVLSETWCRR